MDNAKFNSRLTLSLF